MTESVRVEDGYYLWVEDGPLIIDDVPWYRVATTRQTDDVAGEDVDRWDADGDEFRFDYGWIAGGDGVSMYLVPDDLPPLPPDQPVYGDAPDPYALAHGVRDGRTGSFQLDSPVGIRWYAADPEGDACRISMTLEPLAIEMLSTDVDEWDGGDDWWPQPYDGHDALPSGDHWIEVQTDCSWSLRVVRIIG